MNSEWLNWEEVTSHLLPGRRLFRASSPNYIPGLGDRSQKLTDSAIAFVSQNNVDTIVSFNKVPYTAEEQARLRAAGISYRHVPVEDFTAATLEQLESVANLFEGRPDASVLLHCGYGRGRTGTGVTAVQLAATKGQQPPDSDWQKVNHVETQAQLAVLRQLRDQYQVTDDE